MQGVGLIAIVVVLGVNVVDQFAAIRAQFGVLLGASVLFTLAMLVSGLLVAKFATRSDEDQRAILWGLPARKVAIASFIAVVFATQIVRLMPLAMWLRRR